MKRIFQRYAALLAGISLVALGAALVYLGLLADLPDPFYAPGRLAAPSILITDRNGLLLYEVIDPNGSKNVPLPLAEIPQACRQATVATEDSRFYSHFGVDLIAIARAAWQNRHTDAAISGASTLTQQVARTLFLSEDERVERSLRRKLREAWLAWRLEQRYGKDELLALYLNTTYYGHFAVGIEAAAQAYFGIHARELDLAQCALIAGLPQYPAGYNPIENPEAARNRQKTVLALMVSSGYVNAAQAEDAGRERLAYAGTPFPIEAPHFVSWVQGQLEQLLGPDTLRSGGLRVVTTLDLNWQHQAEAILTRRLSQLQPCTAAGAGHLTPAEPQADGLRCDPYAAPARRVDNAALVALDPYTGAVLAMVGSPDYFDAAISGAVNGALSLRQPGSAIKPLTYAAAFDPERAGRAGQPWTPATLIADVRTVFPTAEGQPYVPMNYDLAFHGPVLARTALASSYNIPAVKALGAIGVDALVGLAARLGIPWDDRSPISAQQESEAKFGLALTLGGGEVRLLDLVAAYAAFANGGRRTVPYGISRIETLDRSNPSTSSGQAVPTFQPANVPTSIQALDPRVAYLITDILSDETARLPTFGAGSVLEIGRPAAVKTGTTTDWRDNWTVGYTPDLVTGVWVGNADNTPMRDVSGVTGAGPIWHDFMVAVQRNTPSRSFPRPAGLVRVEVCADSGLLPSAATQRTQPAPGLQSTEGELLVPCPYRRFEWFIAGTEPTQVDRSHVRVALDTRTGRPADAGTLAQAVATPQLVSFETIWRLPPVLADWARENGIAQPVSNPSTSSGQAVPTFERSNPSASSGQAVGTSSELSLASPDANRTYRLDPGLPANTQKLAIVARPEPGTEAQERPVTLLLDGVAFATVTGPDYTAWWPLSRGRHVWQAIASRADGTQAVSTQVLVVVE